MSDRFRLWHCWALMWDRKSVAVVVVVVGVVTVVMMDDVDDDDEGVG